METMAGTQQMARKKAAASAKQSGSLIRVSDEFAEALKTAARIENMSVAEFADAYLITAVQKRYREAVLKEAKRLGGQ